MYPRIALFLVLGLFGVSTAWQSSAQNLPPAIVFHPTNRVSSIGGSATFIVTASGSNLVYRWRKEGIPLANGTNRLLSLINLSNGNAGAYTVVVTNFFGSVTSQPAMLTLTGAPPRIYYFATNALVCAGSASTILTVMASGSPPFQYQWRREGINMPGQTNATFRVPGEPTSVGNYSAIVANAYGSETSQVARLELGPIITQQPTDTTVYAGTEVRFTVEALTCSNPRYQWRFNGVDITGYSTNQALNLYFYPTNAGYEGDLTVVVTDSFRSVTSAVARLTVRENPPVITQQPWDALWTVSPYAFFRVGYSGTPAPHLQWRFNGVNLPGATNAYLYVPSAPANEGGYSVVVSNSNGSVTSRVAVLTVRAIQPVIGIYGQPQSQVLCASDTNHPNLFVTLYEQGLCFFQWWKDGVAMPGETNSALYRAKSPESFGSYQVVVTNFFGAVTSEVATVSAGPLIVRQPPELIEADIGGTAYLSAGARFCWPAQLQWQRNGVDVPWANTTDLQLSSLSLADSGDYTLIVRQASGSVTSTVARLEVIQRPPTLEPDSAYPYDQEIRAGELASFNLASYDPGAPACTFQWWFNGQPILGATGSYHEFTADSLRQQGRYFVVLSNEVGSVTSRVARLTLLFSLPYFDVEPEDINVPVGQSAYFTAYAVGAPPPTYQWLFNDTPLRGQTNDWLEFEFRSTNQTGGYSVVASNFLGAVTSRVATLNAELFPPSFIAQPASQSVTAGQNVYLYAYANGSPLPYLQWYHDGVAIPGANAVNLSFTAGYLDQVGEYYLVASNFLGTATSAVAQVNIGIVPPRIVVHPAPQQLVAGERLGLFVTISNNVPARFQWHRDGFAIPGETNYYFEKRTTTTNNSGEYHVTAWNNGGVETSRVARVEVRLPEALDRWSWRRPVPQGNHLYDVAYGEGRYVAVGENGALVVSTNGTDWTDAHKPGHHHNRSSIVFGNGVFLADEDGFQRSTNGMDWIDTPYPGPVYPGFLFGNGRFVGSGSGSATNLLVSTNGLDWEAVNVSPSVVGLSEEFSDQWYFVPFAFVNDRFLANYEVISPLSETGLLYSTNGLDWQRAEVTPSEVWGPTRVASVAYGNGIYLGVFEGSPPEVLRSTDGHHWAPLPLAEPFLFTATSIAFGNGRFVVGGFRSFYPPHHSLMNSTDGMTWTTIETAGTNSTYKVRFENDRFVAVGPYGRLLTSTNGLEWTGPNAGSDLNLRSVIRTDGLFVAVGNDGLILTSAEGHDWIRRDLGTNINLRAVTHFKGRYIAVGEGENSIAPERISIYTSPDAVHWQPANSTDVAGRGNLYSLAHSDDTTVVVGDRGSIAWSHNGLHWYDAISGSANDLNAVIWNANAFYAAGKDGTVLTSANGVNWLSIGPGGGRNLHGIAYGNGVFVTVANGGRYFVGTGDGSWSRHDWRSAEDLSDIIFAGGRFIAIGDNGIVHTSPNGTNWTRRVNPSGNDLRSIIYSEGSYWVVGNNETILQSHQIDPALRIGRVPGSADVAIELLGEAGASHRLQGSYNFTDWTDILSFTTGPEPYQHRTGDPAAAGRRFYRVVRP